MTTNNDPDAFQADVLTQRRDDFDYAPEDGRNLAAIYELPYPAEGVTRHMTATWGN